MVAMRNIGPWAHRNSGPLGTGQTIIVKSGGDLFCSSDLSGRAILYIAGPMVHLPYFFDLHDFVLHSFENFATISFSFSSSN